MSPRDDERSQNDLETLPHKGEAGMELKENSAPVILQPELSEATQEQAEPIANRPST